MLSKVLAGVLAVAVLTVGGYAYWQYTDGSHCCGSQLAVESAADTPDCCQQPSRASCMPLAATDAPACCESEAAAPEVLAIAPRELK